MIYGGLYFGESAGVTLYLPTGETTVLSKANGAVFQTPSKAAVAYASNDDGFPALYLAELDATSSPLLLENGSLGWPVRAPSLAASARRDLRLRPLNVQSILQRSRPRALGGKNSHSGVVIERGEDH